MTGPFLSVGDGGLGKGNLIQLCPNDAIQRFLSDRPTVAYSPGPDEPPSLVLTRMAAP